MKNYCAFLFAVFCLGLFSQQANAQKPNIVVLYSDDAGYGDFGFQPDVAEDIKDLTPHIDSIATNGVRCSNAYMSGAVCSPSRAGLMTARYQQRFGFENNLPPGHQNGVSLDEKFATNYMRELGYTTGLIGKWHLGYPEDMHPNKRGFDYFYGLLQGSRGYFPIEKPSPNRVIRENGKPTPETGYVTNRFGDAACNFIKKQDDKPFFLFVSFTAPHSPNQPHNSVAERTNHITKRQRKNYAGLVANLDDNVGKVLKCLEEENLLENTLVIFTNDNGGATHTGANNGKLLGKKGDLSEGGIRVPWAMQWKGTIPAGTDYNEPIISLDIFPTCIELAGGKIKDEWNFDGRSFQDILKDPTAPLAQRPLFWRVKGSKGNRAVRVGNWKLLHNRLEGEQPKLFDLSNDIGETKDLSANEADRVKGLTAQLDEWEKGLVEPLWGSNLSKKEQAKKRKERPKKNRDKVKKDGKR